MTSDDAGKDILCGALDLIRRDPDTLLDAVDQILIAATQLQQLSLTAARDGHVIARVNGDAAVEMYISRSSLFRSVLARIGTICDSAARKRSISGKTQTL